MPRFDTIAPGKTPIASYQSIMELGRGGMGTVHLARAVGAGGFERLVVVKRLNRDLLDRPDAVRRFLDEARHAALIHHANVVGIHQIGSDQEGFFLVLDYVEGGSLDALVARAAKLHERVPPPIVLRICLDALAGLHAAHLAEDQTGKLLGLLHRDVSLQNVLVGRDGVSRIADFGIAKSALASVVTDHRYMVGKLMYMPREYLWRLPVGPTLDVYALGVTMWIAFVGTDPFPDVEDAQLVTKILNERIPRLSDVGVRIAPKVDALVAKACEPDATDRYQSAREMADAIEAIGRETGWLASHGEVASYVERLLGPELRQRREQVAFFVERSRDGAPVYESGAPPPDPAADMTIKKPRPALVDTSEVSIPTKTSRAKLIAPVAALAIAGSAAVLLWPKGAPKPAYEPVLAQSATSAVLTPQAAPLTPPSAPLPSSAAPAPSAPEARAIDPSTLPKEPAGRPHRAVTDSRPKASAAAAPVPAPPAAPPATPVTAPASPTAASGGLIRKTNPYR